MTYQVRNTFVDEHEALRTRDRLHEGNTKSLSIVDRGIDDIWAQMQVDSRAPKSYFDYYYAGEDIRAYVAETGDDPDFGNLPMQAVGFNVSQEKQPIYGYWSYTYDAMLRGTRLISGGFVLVTKRPNYMKELLSAAAKNRSDNRFSPVDEYPSPWTNDEENIQKYWGKHLDPSARKQQGTEWSIHPPFAMVLVYGIQDTSVDVKDVSNFDAYSKDNALMYDRNQRLTEDSSRHASRIILDGCELTGVDRQFTPGQVAVEQYSFLARDIFVPEEDGVGWNRLSNSGHVVE